MLTLRSAADRGHANHGWLDTWHTFSFANYYDPAHMGFRALRVINDDRIAAGMGFGTHPHNDMEILTYVISGRLAHRDSLGSGGVIEPGEVQYMSAGSGIRHSEYNASQTEPLHLFQIWLMPNETGLRPQYGQRPFPVHEQRDRLHLLASPDGRGGSIRMHADALLYAARLTPGARATHRFEYGHGWLQVTTGSVRANGTELKAGDGLAIDGEAELRLEGVEEGELLLFDLA